MGIWREAINFHPKHLGGVIKIQFVLCIGGGHLKFNLIIGPVQRGILTNKLWVHLKKLLINCY